MKKFFSLLIISTVTLHFSKSFAQDNLKNYWQQEVNYTIQVKLDDVKNFLYATESIDYINHSPDTLKFIWFHLWANAYKNNNTAFAKQKVENGAVDFYFSKEEDRGFIDSLNFEVNGETVKLEYDPNNIDIARIWLNKPLAPNSQITITTPFRVKIPKNFSRMGHVGQQYQISQWYPKPAVYDRKGWHPIPYLDQGEFYSEFGVFDVFITLPKNYVMDATGSLINEDEKNWLQIKEAASRKKLGIEMNELQKEIAVDDSFGIVFPPSSTEMKTLHYHAEDVHDFAWFADKRYLIVKDAVTLESGKKVETTVLFTEDHANVWRNAVHFVDSAVFYYSKWIGDYPYPHATAVDGALVAGGGMEYPMITVVGKTTSAGSLDNVIAHEVGHNWFYGILGFNERDHPWMDEGINSYYEDRYGDRNLKPGNSIAPKFLGLAGMTNEKLKYLTYLIVARPHNDQPADIPATQYTQLNYGAIIYAKVPVMMSHLAASMGQQEYDSTMHTLFNEWQFKHVYPEDMKNVFEQSSPMSFDWFFNQYLNTTDHLDFKLLNAKDTMHIGSSA
ncbi:MAG: M1 family metallopeptidase, partial [Bacteroidota bacterium]